MFSPVSVCPWGQGVGNIKCHHGIGHIIGHSPLPKFDLQTYPHPTIPRRQSWWPTPLLVTSGSDHWRPVQTYSFWDLSPPPAPTHPRVTFGGGNLYRSMLRFPSGRCPSYCNAVWLLVFSFFFGFGKSCHLESRMNERNSTETSSSSPESAPRKKSWNGKHEQWWNVNHKTVKILNTKVILT